MLKRRLKIGAAMVALTAGLVAIPAGPAMANGACGDFIRIYEYYRSIGDDATADALYRNLLRDGCVDDREVV